ncbi:MAG: TonB-dependent receptor [Myxococcota bacterium]
MVRAFFIVSLLAAASVAQAEELVPPKLLEFVAAEVPADLSAPAAVLLELAIDETGAVVEVQVLESGGPALDALASAAAARFRFQPATADGQPIPVKIAYRYAFVLREERTRRTTAELSGTVRDRKTKAPLAGVTISADSGATAVSTATGAFYLAGLPAGERTISLSGPSLKAIGTTETLTEGEHLVTIYEVEIASADAEEDEYAMEVTAPRLAKKVVSTAIAAEESRMVPGAQGDVLKVVENMPGVGRSSVGSGALVVWGAAPEDTRVYIDGIRVPRLYHNGGVRSVVHSDLVRGVELFPGGYGAPYGRGLGGLVTVELRDLEPGLHGSVGIDLLDVAGAVRGGIGDRLTGALAFRRSHLDALVKAVTKEDVGDFIPIPRYWDGQARLALQLSKTQTLELGGLISLDEIEHRLDAKDPADVKIDTQSIGFGRIYLRYEDRPSSGSVISLVPSFGRDVQSQVSRFGGAPTSLDVSSSLVGFRGTYRGKVSENFRLEAGLDAELTISEVRRQGSIASPPREGDLRVFGQPPSDQISADHWSTTLLSLAPFAEADLSLFSDRLHIIPGLRLEPYVIGGDRVAPQSGDNLPLGFQRETTFLEPRLAVRYKILEALTVKAGFGVYHQAPDPNDLSASFGNPHLDPATAVQGLGGFQLNLSETLSLDLTGFFAASSGLAVRSPSESPVAGQALLQTGLGRAYGAQILLRQEKVAGFFGWISYSLIRSERNDGAGGVWRAFDYDQTHVLTVVASYDLGAGFDVGLRFRASSGYPRTPVLGAFFDARRDQYTPIFGPQNSERIPPFVQLDLRVEKTFSVLGGDAEIYLDLQNMTNQSNPEEIVYNFNYQAKSTITGLPIMPVAGFKWSY